MELHFFILKIVLKEGSILGNVTAIHRGGREMGVVYIRPENMNADMIFNALAEKLSEMDIKGFPRLGNATEVGVDQVAIPWKTPQHSGEILVSVEQYSNLTKRVCDSLNKDLAKVA